MKRMNWLPCLEIFVIFKLEEEKNDQCAGPAGVCWCKDLGEKIQTDCHVVILQHPHEEKRCLRTAPILEALIPKENYCLLKGKKFNPSRFSELKDVLKSPNSVLLYPGVGASDLEDLPPVGVSQSPYNIFILDGTWQQAKSMFHRNPYLRDLKQVRLSGKHVSEYVIRRQPTDDALSTVEVVAITLSMLESNWGIYKALVDPLKLICQFQMNHGAVKHDSKEFLILTGRYKKPLGKRTYKKLKKCGGVRNGNVTVPELKAFSDQNNEEMAPKQVAPEQNNEVIPGRNEKESSSQDSDIASLCIGGECSSDEEHVESKRVLR